MTAIEGATESRQSAAAPSQAFSHLALLEAAARIMVSERQGEH